MPITTMRERMLAVVRGDPVDRVPFVQYDNNAAPNEEIWREIGRENMGLLRWCAAHRYDHPNCRFEYEEILQGRLKGYRRTLITPKGTLTEQKLLDPALGSAATRQHFIRKPEDYAVLLAYLRDIRVSEDISSVLSAVRDLEDDGLPLVAVARTPYQQLWIEWVCIEDLCFHLADCPEIVEECIAALADIERRIFETVLSAARKIALPFVDFPDNITAPVIGERYFRRYCVPLYNELAGLLSDRSIPVVVHMDGDLKPLWQAIGESEVAGLDSLSPPPDNDTSVAQALAMWPRMRLFINFPSSVHLASPEAVYRATRELLSQDAASGRIWIQISENVPPGRWRASYPAIVRAIREG
ncbi:MAG: hypothetical protein IT210_24165 [Armatimonadetes bacterium]|nr:hypothetical protein [Armatimonadota bacterium]